jgi:hypothetical protein
MADEVQGPGVKIDITTTGDTAGIEKVNAGLKEEAAAVQKVTKSVAEQAAAEKELAQWREEMAAKRKITDGTGPGGGAIPYQVVKDEASPFSTDAERNATIAKARTEVEAEVIAAKEKELLLLNQQRAIEGEVLAIQSAQADLVKAKAAGNAEQIELLQTEIAARRLTVTELTQEVETASQLSTIEEGQNVFLAESLDAVKSRHEARRLELATMAAQEELNKQLVADEEARIAFEKTILQLKQEQAVAESAQQAEQEASGKVYGRLGRGGAMLRNLGIDMETLMTGFIGVLLGDMVQKKLEKMTEEMNKQSEKIDELTEKFHNQITDGDKRIAQVKTENDLHSEQARINEEITSVVEARRKLTIDAVSAGKENTDAYKQQLAVLDQQDLSLNNQLRALNTIGQRNVDITKQEENLRDIREQSEKIEQKLAERKAAAQQKIEDYDVGQMSAEDQEKYYQKKIRELTGKQQAIRSMKNPTPESDVLLDEYQVQINGLREKSKRAAEENNRYHEGEDKADQKYRDDITKNAGSKDAANLILELLGRALGGVKSDGGASATGVAVQEIGIAATNLKEHGPSEQSYSALAQALKDYGASVGGKLNKHASEIASLTTLVKQMQSHIHDNQQ